MGALLAIMVSMSSVKAASASSDGPVDESEPLVRLLAESRCPFGPRFFLSQLAAFVRERCPDPGELPRVDLWIDGEPHTICHVVAIAPRWLALAVWNGRGDTATMSLEIVPYELISRITIGSISRAHAIGFAQVAPPTIIEDAIATPEEALARVAQPGLTVDASGADPVH